MRYLLTGDPWDAQTAYRIGVVRTGTGVDPLKDFAEAVREESEQFV
jgi:enoyl-CoA hydratase/carnithine racemase